MPRPILRPGTAAQNSQKQMSALAAGKAAGKTSAGLRPMEAERILRKKRSDRYMKAIQNLDAGGHVMNQKQVDDFIRTIQEEFPELEIDGILLGIIAPCFLGKPFEVHTLDMKSSIVEHYERGKELPGGLEKARGIDIRGGYAFIEVYLDCCRAVSRDGTVAVIHC